MATQQYSLSSEPTQHICIYIDPNPEQNPDEPDFKELQVSNQPCYFEGSCIQGEVDLEANVVDIENDTSTILGRLISFFTSNN